MLIPCDKWYVGLNGSRRYPNLVLWNHVSLPLKIAADARIQDGRCFTGIRTFKSAEKQFA